MTDPNHSPVGWYVGSYLIRFVELNESGNDEEESQFLVWENTILVQADSLSEAFDKVEAEAKLHTEPYKGGKEGVPVQWLYEGISELIPVYDKIEDGVEIMFSEYRRKLKNIRKDVLSKNDLHR
jgi:hypothetical protein